MKRTLAAALVVVLTALLPGLVASLYADAPPQMDQLFFGDDFDGTTLDAAKWNVTLATSGRRWCADGYALFDPGQWVDASVSPCYGKTQMPPYGTITVGGGAARFAAPVGRAFPYVWHGLPSMLSPFPSNGDFALEVRMRYDSIMNAGTGVWAANWPNTEPEGNNPPSSLAGDIFGVWADSFPGPRTWLFGEVKPIPVSDGLFHVFRFEFRNGAYSLFMDDALLAGPAASAVRPNALWIGNPGFTWWSVDDWTDFTVDYFRVLRPSSDTVAPVVSGVSLTPNPTVEANPVALAAIATDPAPATYIAAAEWFEGADPGVGNGLAMAATDGVFDSPTEALTATVSVAGWTTGTHTLSVRATDAAGNWSTSVTATLKVLPAADLTLAKTAAPGPALLGQSLTYTVTVANNGPSTANGVIMTDTLPSGVAFASAFSSQGSCARSGGTVNCSLGSLASRAIVTATIAVTPTAAGIITNTATVSATEPDPNTANNTATVATTTVSPVADLAVTKSGSPDPVTAGTSLTYTISVSNNGPSAAANVSLSDTIPVDTSFQSLTAATGWTCATPAAGAAGIASCSNPTLAASTTAFFTLTVQVNAGTPAGSSIANRADVSSATPDPASANDTALARTAVVALDTGADLSLTLNDSPDRVSPGASLNYRITLYNIGPSTASNLVLTAAVPLRTTFKSVTKPSPWTCATPPEGGTGNVVCTASSLGTVTRTITMRVVVDNGTPAGTLIAGRATVASATPDPNPANNTATASTEVTAGHPTAVTLSGFGASSGLAGWPVAGATVVVALAGAALWQRRERE